jgi:hypothetical protein
MRRALAVTGWRVIAALAVANGVLFVSGWHGTGRLVFVIACVAVLVLLSWLLDLRRQH